MISKELLSKVLEENISEVYKMGSNPNFKQNTLLFKLYGCGELCNINIYELAHKCKEWAKYNEIFGNSGYDLYTEHLKGINYNSAMGDKPLNKNYNYWRCFYSISNTTGSTIGQGITEPEAIFKACQWILNNKDGK